MQTHLGNGVERIHAVHWIHPEGEAHRLPSMSENATLLKCK